MYDIHFGNFMIQHNTVYAIDLGMAFPYASNGKHIASGRSPIPDAIKNHRFTSRNDDRGLTLSRRDDLERLVYLIIDMMTGTLPWSSLSGSDRRRFKASLSPSDICAAARWMLPAVEHVWKLGFRDKPNYNYLRSVFYQHMGILMPKGSARRK